MPRVRKALPKRIKTSTVKKEVKRVDSKINKLRQQKIDTKRIIKKMNESLS